MKSRRLMVAWISVAAIVVPLTGCGTTTRSTAPAVTLDTTPPSIPDELTQSRDPYTRNLQLEWSPSPSPDVASYDVYMYSPDPSRENSFIKVGETSAPAWSLPTSASDQTYTFRVRAVDGAGNASAFSSSFTTTVPASLPPAGGGGSTPDDDGHRRRIDS